MFNSGYTEGCITPDAQDLIKRFLDPNPATRLGSRGLDEIKNHSFFRGKPSSSGEIEWDRVYDDEPPELVMKLLLRVDVPTSRTEMPEEATRHLQDIQASNGTNEKIQSKLENFDQIRYDLLDKHNKKAYEQML